MKGNIMTGFHVLFLLYVASSSVFYLMDKLSLDAFMVIGFLFLIASIIARGIENICERMDKGE